MVKEPSEQSDIAYMVFAATGLVLIIYTPLLKTSTIGQLFYLACGIFLVTQSLYYAVIIQFARDHSDLKHRVNEWL